MSNWFTNVTLPHWNGWNLLKGQNFVGKIHLLKTHQSHCDIYSIWQHIHGSTTPLLRVCVIISTCVLSKISSAFVKSSKEDAAGWKTRQRREMGNCWKAWKQPVVTGQPDVRRKQKWALMRKTKRVYLPTNKHSSPDTSAIVWSTSCQRFVCSPLHAPHASPVAKQQQRCSPPLLTAATWRGVKAAAVFC